MEKVKCDHCGIQVNKKDAIPCHWDEYNLTWYYCKRCDSGVFGSRVKNKEVVDKLIESSKSVSFSIGG